MSKKYTARLKARVVPIQNLTDADITRMYAIMCKYYNSVLENDFRRDLSKKTCVVLLREIGTQMIQGFSTLLSIELKSHGRSVQCIYSGDTIVEEAFWGQRGLQLAFSRFILMEKLKRPFKPVYWFLISKGYKTYLLMSNNFFEHYPRFEKAVPKSKRDLMNAFYGSLYPQHYRPESGLIQFTGESCRLKQGVAAISPELIAKNPRIAFFEKTNPRWREGTELACLAKITGLEPIGYFFKAFYRLKLTQALVRIPRYILTGSTENA